MSEIGGDSIPPLHSGWWLKPGNSRNGGSTDTRNGNHPLLTTAGTFRKFQEFQKGKQVIIGVDGSEFDCLGPKYANICQLLMKICHIDLKLQYLTPT